MACRGMIFWIVALAVLLTSAWRCSAQTTSPAASPTTLPADQQDLARAADLIQQTIKLFSQGNAPEALAKGQEALAIRQRVFKGADHALVADALTSVAYCQRALGNSSEALSKFETALAMLRRLQKNRDSPGAAMALDCIADCLMDLNRAPEALARYEETVVMLERLTGKRDLPIMAAELTKTATCLMTMDRPADALAKYESALAIRKRLPQDPRSMEIPQLLSNIGYCLHAMGRMEEALPKFESSLELMRAAHPGADDPAIATNLNNIASCLIALNRHADALAKYEEALAIRQRLHKGQDHSEVAASLNNLGYCLQSMGRLLEALPKYESALAMLQRLTEGHDHPAVARALNNVAACLDVLGRSAEALPKYQTALAMRRRLFGGADHPDIADSLNNVATCLDSLGHSKEALEKYQEALLIVLRLHPRQDHPAVARAINNVASCLDELGRPGEALPQYQQALEMRQRLAKNRDDCDVATSLNNVGSCLDTLGRSTEGLSMHEAALAMFRRIYKDQDHPDVALGLNNLGSCLEALGRRDEALAQYDAALAMRRRVYKDQDHPDIAASLNNAACCLLSLGRGAEALGRFESSLAMRRRIHQHQDHASIARAINNVGWCFDILGRPAEALPRYQAALAMVQRLYKDQDHPDVATCLSSVASSLASQNHAAEALPLYQSAQAMLERTFAGQDHPDVARAMNNTAFCRHLLGQYPEALREYEAALAMMRRVFKDRDQFEMALAQNNIAGCLESIGRLDEALTKYQAAVSMAQRLRAPCLSMCAASQGLLLLQMGKPADAAASFDLSILSLEQLRLRLGGDDQDRMTYMAEQLRRFDPFAGMVRAQLKQGQPARALEYLERGRSRGLLDVLERANRLQGSDVLSPVQKLAEARQDQRVLDDVRQTRQRLSQSQTRVGQLTAQISRLRGRVDVEESQKAREMDALQLELADAQEQYARAHRDAYNLAAEQAAADLKPLACEQFQEMLSAKQRLLVYSVTRKDALLLVVGPVGQPVRCHTLTWPDGRPVDAASLAEVVDAYTRGMARDAGRSRAVRFTPASHPATTARADELGHRLMQALAPPDVWREIQNADTVFLVPDGVLHRLPFETLVVTPSTNDSAASRRYWLDDGPALVYGPSATVLVNRAKARSDQLERQGQGSVARRLAVALGDPVFSLAAPASAPVWVPGKGLLVVKVEPGSAAERLGLTAGSVILSYGGQEIATIDEFDAVLDKLMGQQRRRQLKQTPVLKFWHEGQIAEAPVMPSEQLGASLRELTPALAAQLASGRAPSQMSDATATVRGGYLTRYGALVPLPGTRQEVAAIYEALTGRAWDRNAPVTSPAGAPVTVLLGADATRTRLYTESAGTRYLHLATHGLMEGGARAIYSSLALSQPATLTASDNGFLTLQDLFENWWGRLSSTELVVLSACDSQGLDEAGQNLQSGEGVLGLPWGFMYAGSTAVIASLWEVDDASTAQLMSDLYGQMKIKGKLDAFVTARRDLRKKYPQPYFWAPFIYIGDPR